MTLHAKITDLLDGAAANSDEQATAILALVKTAVIDKAEAMKSETIGRSPWLTIDIVKDGIAALE